MLALPKGQLLVQDDGILVAQLRASRPARREMRAWFERLSSSRPGNVLAHTRLDDGPHGFEIHYESQPREAISGKAAFEGWRDHPAASIPAILAFGRFLLDVVGELVDRGLGDVFVATATVRFVPGSPDRWRFVPVPTRGMSLGDWSRADPDSLLWTTSESLIGGAPADAVYALGAALRHAISGPPVPRNLPAREKFARLLRARTGLPARLAASLRPCLPRSLEEDGAAIERLILDCLEPIPGARPGTAAVRQRLESLADRLSTDRLIRYWGFENRPEIVARLSVPRERPPDPAGATAPSTGSTPAAPWDEQVSMLVGRGDLTGALAAAWNDIEENGPPRIRFYLAVVQRMAARFPGPSTEVRAAIDRLVDAFGGQLDESDVLRLSHIRIRHLGERTDRLGVSHRRFTSRWNDATGRLLQARLLLTSGQAYNQVSRLCKEARGLYQSMPEEGGRAGLYATAYLCLLDGVAHIGAVAAYRNDSFYNDAFEAFARALELAMRANHESLIQTCLRWFGWLGRFVAAVPGPASSVLAKGIDAVLGSHGLTRDSVAALGVPEVPWYDEGLLFTV